MATQLNPVATSAPFGRSMSRSDAIWLTVGRAIFGAYFLFNGINHFTNQTMMASFAASKGVPAPDLAVTGSGALLLLGGISLLIGLWPKLGAAMIVLFLVAVTPTMHDFWNAEPAARMTEFGNFLKNVALLGGACFAAAVPEPWPASFRADGRLRARSSARA
jgi:putative oxidoreductase